MGSAVGVDSSAGLMGTAVGEIAKAGERSTALGAKSAATGDHAVAVGLGATAGAEKSVALGDGATAGAENSVALGQGAVANLKNTVSVGSLDKPRQIVNVKAGKESVSSTDAVNGSQLFTTNQRVDTLDSNIQAVRKAADKNSRSMQVNTSSAQAAATGEGSAALGGGSQARASKSTAIGEQAHAMAENSVAIGAGSIANEANTLSIGRDGNERRLSHLAPGVSGTDAVNMNQLNTMHNEIDGKMADIQRNAYAGIAAAMAMPNMTPSGPGRSVVAAGVGTYEGYSAVAAGITYRTSGGHWLVNGAISATQYGDMGLRAQAGYEF
ncbi:coiled stalk of trimeric autotransporter adhesin family protein [Burkholderia pseudomallei]|uniref:YadA family autotransporter adhesin n=1 Tax=Burkholderia pseudomallei TaxID=28450 RepID=UPI00050EE0FD|nr:YadA-like family protein [Burkholderia pseudomallei]KGC96359.1 coiled stalk of trimeric autotransporter adhesin family protein [Burkholderia pseudomallei]